MKTVYIFDKNYRITSDFKAHVKGGRPGGIDYRYDKKLTGEPIYAPQGGHVTSKIDKNGGKYVALVTANGMWVMVHLSKFKFKSRTYVRKGQIIGYTGNTGWSTGAHTHVEYRIKKGNTFHRVNPLKYFKIVAKPKSKDQQIKDLEEKVKNLKETIDHNLKLYVEEQRKRKDLKAIVTLLEAENKLLKKQIKRLETKPETSSQSFISIFINKIIDGLRRKS